MSYWSQESIDKETNPALKIQMLEQNKNWDFSKKLAKYQLRGHSRMSALICLAMEEVNKLCDIVGSSNKFYLEDFEDQLFEYDDE